MEDEKEVIVAPEANEQELDAELDKLLTEEEVASDEKETETAEAKIAKQDLIIKAYKARLGKEKAKVEKLKAEKPKLETKQATEEIEKPLSREEAVLLAKGVPEEDIELLKKIQAIGGYKTLAEAKDDKVYQLQLEKREKEEKSKKAQIGSSSASSPKNKGFDTAKLSSEELKELFNRLTNS